MANNNVEELIGSLYEMVQSAWSLPLGADKCVVERDKVLDLLDEISSQLPSELKQAKTIVDSRNEVITSAKREAESILRQAEQRAKQLVSDSEILLQAKAQAEDLIRNAQIKMKELRQATAEYVEDSLKQTEDAVSEALEQVRTSHAKFHSMTNPQQKAPSPIIEDV